MCSAVTTSSQKLACCPTTVTSIYCNGSTTHDRLFSTDSQTLLQSLDNVREPLTYSEAASQPVWQEAMQKEFAALDANHTWDLVPLPMHKKPIVVNGCLRSSVRQMVMWKDARLDWLLGVSLKRKGLILQKLFPLWSK